MIKNIKKLTIVLLLVTPTIISSQVWEDNYYDKSILYENKELIQMTEYERKLINLETKSNYTKYMEMAEDFYANPTNDLSTKKQNKTDHRKTFNDITYDKNINTETDSEISIQSESVNTINKLLDLYLFDY